MINFQKMQRATAVEVSLHKYSGMIHRRVRNEIFAQWRALQAAADAPHTLARSFALGTCLNFLPLPGIDVLLAALLLARCRRLNKAALLLAFAVWNNVVVLPLYAVGYRLGEKVVTAVLPHGATAAPPLLLVLNFLSGAVLVALVASLSGYVAVLVVWGLYRARFR